MHGMCKGTTIEYDSSLEWLNLPGRAVGGRARQFRQALRRLQHDGQIVGLGRSLFERRRILAGGTFLCGRHGQRLRLVVGRGGRYVGLLAGRFFSNRWGSGIWQTTPFGKENLKAQGQWKFGNIYLAKGGN